MFASRFWSYNYSDGLDTLFAKLQQGIVENQELLAVVRARADAESAHGSKLKAAQQAAAPKKNGFGKDDGATMRRAFEGVLQQMGDESRQHMHIADSLKTMVLDPFSKWSASHQQRVAASQSELQRLLKAYEAELNGMNRAQHRYFNRCRLDEDSDAPVEQADDLTSEELLLSGVRLDANSSQQLFKRMLAEIPQKSVHVTILGTYPHTITGAQLVQWLNENSAAKTLSAAEEAGQMFIKLNCLRLVGQIGSRFVNSTQFTYQWRPRAFEFAGLTASTSSLTDFAERWARGTAADSSTQSSVRELDQKYRKAVSALEAARLELEAAMVEHFGYLERCERERLAAFKAVLLDFSASVSNVVPALSAGVDKLLLFHETANVDRDLRFLVESYQTGRYAPRVFVYDNYYSSTDGAAVFGLDLELRARADKKRVPLVVGQILKKLDVEYPQMLNDEERLAMWKRPLQLDMREAQAARSAINEPGTDIQQALGPLLPLAVVQALKMYFLELPVSIVGGPLYDILRGVYQRYAEDGTARVQALQNTLGQLTLTHIATLDAFTSHLHRLVSIAKASEADIREIAAEWGGALCRPKTSTVLAMNDAFPATLLRDLLGDRDRLFGELKRQQSALRERSVSDKSERIQVEKRQDRRGSSPLVQKLDQILQGEEFRELKEDEDEVKDAQEIEEPDLIDPHSEKPLESID